MILAFGRSLSVSKSLRFERNSSDKFASSLCPKWPEGHHVERYDIFPLYLCLKVFAFCLLVTPFLVCKHNFDWYGYYVTVTRPLRNYYTQNVHSITWLLHPREIQWCVFGNWTTSTFFFQYHRFLFLFFNLRKRFEPHKSCQGKQIGFIVFSIKYHIFSSYC